MGQVALGFRSLLIRLAVFVVMAALLAWALGGTLFPRAEIADRDAVGFAGKSWFWRATVGGRERGVLRWQLAARDSAGDVTIDDGFWSDVAGPIVAGEFMYYAGSSADSAWRLVQHAGDGTEVSFPMPDRLAVERQLQRTATGLPIQSAAQIEAERASVLVPDGRDEP